MTDLIEELLTRGVGEFIDPEGIFREKLQTNPEKVVIKFGIDPTRPDIHLGHAVVFRKLRQFQELGCKVIFLLGDFTALIGDPTGKSKVRPEFSQAVVSSNMGTYIKQIPKMLKLEPITEKDQGANIIRDSNGFIVDSPWFSWVRNSDWFFNVTDIDSGDASKTVLMIKNEKGQQFDIPPGTFIGKAAVFENTRMQKLLNKPVIKSISLVNFLAVLRKISFSQLIERDMFQKRVKNNEPLFMHEMLYPVAQGIDSDVIFNIYGACDLEVGGTDQTFNMLMGRRVMEIAGKNKDELQSVLAFKLLEGTDGKEKMSKSLDNYIAITDEPSDMYGKIMSIPDSCIGNYFELCTFTPMGEVDSIRQGLANNTLHPKEIKMSLARQIVAIYHGKRAAEEAEHNFTETFSKGGRPKDIHQAEVRMGSKLAEVLVSEGVVSSKTEWRRLIGEGAVENLETKQTLSYSDEVVSENMTLKIGKHRFIKINIS